MTPPPEQEGGNREAVQAVSQARGLARDEVLEQASVFDGTPWAESGLKAAMDKLEQATAEHVLRHFILANAALEKYQGTVASLAEALLKTEPGTIAPAEP